MYVKTGIWNTDTKIGNAKVKTTSNLLYLVSAEIADHLEKAKPDKAVEEVVSERLDFFFDT